MYISEISGHHSATLAVEKALKMLSPNTEIMNLNAFNYTNPISEKIVNQFYLSVIKATPKIWDFLYDNPKVAEKINKIKETIHKFNSPKLKFLFDKFKPDIVACTQAFPCGMVADFKRTYKSDIPLFAVLTDYVPHSYWIYDNVDNYIVPSDEVAARLEKKGVKPSKIKILGIPFDPKFSERVCREEIFKHLKFDPAVATILIMGGGQGLGPLKKIVKSLEHVKHPIQEIIVTGTNRKLYKSLKKLIKKYRKKIALLGYTDKINEFMSISDIIITKPGGITTAEALSKGLPMIIVKPIPGQEASNTAYLIEKKAAIKTDDPEEINVLIDDLLQSRIKLTRLSESASRISKPNASFDIARLLLGFK